MVQKNLSPGAESFKASMEKGTTKGLQQSATAGANFGQLPMSTGPMTTGVNVPGFTVEQGIKGVTNIPVGERTGALFSNAAASVPESGLKQLVKTAGMEGGMRQLGGEFAKNLMTPQTAIRGLTSGVLSDLTRTPEYAEATGLALDDRDREPILAENRNFAMNTRTAPLSASQILASQTGQAPPLQFTDPKYSPAETGNLSGTLLAKKGGMLDALDSITEGMEDLAKQTDGDVSIKGMIKAAQEGGLMGMQPFEGRVMGKGDGMSDEIPFSIEGQQPALLSRDEYVLPADVVAALGNGSSNAGADKLDGFLTDVREKVMGRKRQINQIG